MTKPRGWRSLPCGAARAPGDAQRDLAKRVCARQGVDMKRLLLILGLAGCVPAMAPDDPAPAVPPAGSYPTGLDNTCDGERYGPLVGQKATALEQVLIMGQVRVIRPGMIVTQDYRPERINFEIGDTGRILRITCG